MTKSRLASHPSAKMTRFGALTLMTMTALVLGLGFQAMTEQVSWAAQPHRKAPARAVTVAKPAAKPAAPSQPAQSVEPTSLLKDPALFLNKPVTFEGTFNSFSSLGLDYKKAMRSSKDYVSILIRRPDVSDHTIPLSELKLIFPRKKSESVMHLESGDVIKVTGQVFSTALNEPWVDVSEVKVIRKLKPTPKSKDCLKDEC